MAAANLVLNHVIKFNYLYGSCYHYGSKVKSNNNQMEATLFLSVGFDVGLTEHFVVFSEDKPCTQQVRAASGKKHEAKSGYVQIWHAVRVGWGARKRIERQEELYNKQ